MVCGRGSHADFCATFLPRAERTVSYHFITEGSCWAALVNDPAYVSRVDAAVLLVVAQGEAHLMVSSLDPEPAPSDDLMSKI